MKMKHLPAVTTVRGLTTEFDTDPKDGTISIQYEDAEDHLCELTMGFLDGMYLLSCLRATQLDCEFQMPDDPRLPADRKPLRR